MNLPPLVAQRVAPNPLLHLQLTSKVLWIGGPDTGKTTHAKQVVRRYPKGAVWDPGHEWTPRDCVKDGFLIARTLDGLEKAAAQSSRVVLQPPKFRRGVGPKKEFEEKRAALGDEFSWWCLERLRGPCFVYFDEPHTMFDKNGMPGGLAELLRRGHKEPTRLAMGWSAWGARELPNDLENVSHVVAFRPEERNDVKRIDSYFGSGWSEVSEALPDFWHLVRQKNPATRMREVGVFPPIRVD